MRGQRGRSIAVIGAGPAGTTLATLLARAGIRVAVFSRGRPSGLVVGESLVPAVVPILRTLGVEDEVRAYASTSRGTFVVDRDFRSRSRSTICGGSPPTPKRASRPPTRRCARPAQRGARLIEARRRSSAPGSPASAAIRAAVGEAPRRLECLGGPRTYRRRERPSACCPAARASQPGQERRDGAFGTPGVVLDHPGHVHSDRLEQGWCWRIPLPGRVSLGIVAEPAVFRSLGEKPEEQYDAFLAADPHLKRIFEGGRRLTPVLRYGNYQLTTLRGVGDGWALLGDAFGFIDPVFSSGLFLAMDGALALAHAIRAGTPAALRRYERRQLRHIEAWRRAVGYFYDGRFFALFRMRDEAKRRGFGRLVDRHVSKHVAGIFTGEKTTRRYSRWVTEFLITHSLGDQDLGPLRVA
jgi:2-polyprenyl-6-methoxyphenol hydroxylase-like FAD-dependent oxidoreductase